MKNVKYIFILIVFGFLVSCSTNKKTVVDPNYINTRDVNVFEGSSYETAVVINESSETEGVNAEYAWIKEHYPGSEVTSQALNYYKDKPYDIIDIVNGKGEKLSLYFDISKFFGKF